MPIQSFLDILGPTLDKINKERKTIVLLEDLNINLFKHNDPNIIKFVDTLSSFSLNPYLLCLFV